MSQDRILEILLDNPDEGLSVREITEALGVAQNTVRTELHRLSKQGLVVAGRYTVKGKAGRFSKWWRLQP